MRDRLLHACVVHGQQGSVPFSGARREGAFRLAIQDYFAIKEWTDEAPDAADEARPVGLEKALSRIDATPIRLTSDGVVLMEPEIQLDVIRGLPLDMRTEDKSSHRPPQFANTIEVRCHDSICSSNQTVVVAAYPYSWDWFSWSRFKKARDAGLRRDDKAKLEAMKWIHTAQEADDPASILEEAPFDLFTTNKKWVFARFLGPYERTAGNHITVRTRTPRRSKKRLDVGSPNRFIRTNSAWLWGICTDFEACRESLEQSAQELLKESEIDSILSANNHELQGEMGNYWHTFAPPVLEASIVKALAGIPPSIPLIWKAGVDRLAIHLVAHIYKKYMLNLAMRLGARKVREVPIAESRVRVVDPEIQFVDFRTCVERYRNLLFNMELTAKQAERAIMTTESLLDDDTPQVIEGCAMLCALAERAQLPDSVVLKIKGLSQGPADVRAAAREAMDLLNELSNG